MIKIKAYFSDGLFKEFETYFPLSNDTLELLNDNYYGMDYAVLETDINKTKIVRVQDFVNECYDLYGMMDFADSIKNWTEKDIDKFIEENEID